MGRAAEDELPAASPIVNTADLPATAWGECKLWELNMNDQKAGQYKLKRRFIKEGA